jgi:hypothetical protein
MGKKKTIEEVSEIFKTKNCILVTNHYENTKQKLDFICSCGREDSKNLDSFKRKSSCKFCSIETNVNKRRLSFQEVKNAFEVNGCVLLIQESEYKNTKTRMKCLCKCGKEMTKRYEDVINGQHCQDCRSLKISARVKKYDINDVREFLKRENCTLLSKSYKTTKTKIEYLCTCGNRDIKRFSAFMDGQRCKQCGIEKHTGANNWNWNPEKTDEERIKERKFYEYSVWRKQVFERDSYTCNVCENVGGTLAGHHLDGWHWCKEKRLDVNNGITLCSSCHHEFHEAYGRHWNTREQFDEWYENKRNTRKNKDAS